jgi:serine/threonine protein phosphatase PrpC
MKLSVTTATDPGLKRSQNEDTVGCWLPETEAQLEQRGTLLVVADGMGGARAGEVASRLAVETVIRSYRTAAGAPLEDLLEAVRSANHVVHADSRTHPERGGMGTTCTAMVVRESEAYLAHVGDSRAYLIRNGGIEQLTRDHSLVAQLVRDQQITAEQARTDPRRNVVTRSVGIGAEVEIDAERVATPLREQDTLLLCTDGLHGVVTDEELCRLASDARPERACDALIALARERGAPDNVSVILARLDRTGDPPRT